MWHLGGQRPITTASLQVPGLEPFRGSLEEIYDKFNKYKRTVPVRCVPVSFLPPDIVRRATLKPCKPRRRRAGRWVLHLPMPHP